MTTDPFGTHAGPLSKGACEAQGPAELKIPRARWDLRLRLRRKLGEGEERRGEFGRARPLCRRLVRARPGQEPPPVICMKREFN